MKYIPLTKGQTAIVDDADYEILSAYKWHYAGYGYAARTIYRGLLKTKVFMHSEILQTPDGMMCDHINGNRLDNRRANLRVATSAENVLNRGMGRNNSSGYKGVTWHKRIGKWQSLIQFNGKAHYLGLYDNPEDAARAYNKKARELYGEFARVNEVRP